MISETHGANRPRIQVNRTLRSGIWPFAPSSSARPPPHPDEPRVAWITATVGVAA